MTLRYQMIHEPLIMRTRTGAGDRASRSECFVGRGQPVASRRGARNRLNVPLLVRHPDTPPGGIHTVDAELRRTFGGAIAIFRSIGDVSKLVVPPPASPVRTDGLWRTTCFELFVSGEGDSYREFNLSPSGAWAAYEFDGYRSGMRESVAQIEIETSFDNKVFTLTAKIESEFALPSHVGLTAVIEEADGALRYWATSFALGKPDFHAAAVRSLLFDGVSAE